MHLNQLLDSATCDASSLREALRVRKLLQTLGPSEIYAVDMDPRLPEVRPLSEYPSPSSAQDDDLMIAHVSVGSERFFRFLSGRRERLVIRHHGTPPPEAADPFDAGLAERLRMTKTQLAAIAPRIELGLAVSSFAEDELRRQGISHTRTSPLVTSIDTLLMLAPTKRNGDAFGPCVLCVGDISPVTGIDDTLLAFHVLKTYLLPDARLVVAGFRPNPVHRGTLDRLVNDLGLVDVEMHGQVRQDDLAALYSNADALVCMSRYEAFGAPLVEAMAFGVPIVAGDVSGVAETLGAAGVLLPGRSPTLVAEALLAVIADPSLRSRIVKRGRERVQAFMPDKTATAFLRHVTALV